jgi:hypothetical protein
LKGRSHAASAQQTLNIAAATTRLTNKNICPPSHRTLERLIDRRPKSREVQIRKNQSEKGKWTLSFSAFFSYALTIFANSMNT